MTQAIFHTSGGGLDFVGLRKSRQGEMEIVYDDGVARRMIWRVTEPVPETQLGEALRRAATATRMLPAIYAELKKRSIAIEAVCI